MRFDFFFKKNKNILFDADKKSGINFAKRQNLNFLLCLWYHCLNIDHRPKQRTSCVPEIHVLPHPTSRAFSHVPLMHIPLHDGQDKIFSRIDVIWFVKAMQSGWLNYNGLGFIIQHIFQTAYLAVAVCWTFNRCVNTFVSGSRTSAHSFVKPANGRGYSQASLHSIHLSWLWRSTLT